MNKNFLNHEQSLALRELGFDGHCFAYYTGDKQHLVIRPSMGRQNEELNYIVCTAPLKQQAFKFFREKYNYNVVITSSYNSGKTYYFRIETPPTNGYQYYKGDFKTYEQAEEACINKLIEIAKDIINK